MQKQLLNGSRRKVKSQGAKANRNGKQAEDTIYCILKERGYLVRRQIKACLSVYEKPIYCDIWVDGIPEFPDGLIIESKWQSVGGSVDEKYVYLATNIMERYPVPAIVVLAGNGASRGAKQWLKNQVDGKQLVAVFSFEEFMQWTMENL